MSNVIPIISITTSEMEPAFAQCHMGGHADRQSALFLGVPGCGKTAMAKNVLAPHAMNCKTIIDGIAREIVMNDTHPDKCKY